MPNALIFTLLLLLTLTGCGGSQGTSSANFEISHSFTAANPFFSGGLMVVGENQTTGKKFSGFISGTNSKTFTLENGQWLFTAYAWDGGPTAPPIRYQGTTFCGATNALLQGDAATVSISVTSAFCADTSFATAVAPKDIKLATCGAFYDYNSATNVYTELTAPTPAILNTFCSSLPLSHRSNITHYRISAVDNSIAGAPIPAYYSGCINANDFQNTPSLPLPSKKFPFMVKLYRSEADCTANGIASHFVFKNGLQSGDALSFDHLFANTGTVAGLILPSSFTRRGKSPFMDMIPQILCGASGSYQDCIHEPPLTAHVNVPWNGQMNNTTQMLLKGAPATVTCANLSFPSFFFSNEACEVKDGVLRAKLYRNELTCQDPTMFSAMIDVYSRNGRVFILRSESGPTYIVDIYTTSGKKIATINLGAGLHQSLAATNNGNIFVTNGTVIRKFEINAQQDGYTEGTSIAIATNVFEVTPNGSYLVAKVNSDINSYLTTSNTIISSLSGIGALSRMQFHDNKVYYLEDSTKYQLSPLDPTTGVLGTPSNIQTGSWSSATIDPTSGYHFFFNTNGDIDVHDSLVIYLGTTSTTITGPSSTTIANNKVYMTNGSGLFVKKWAGVSDASNFTLQESNSENCTESVSVTAGAANKTLDLQSKKTMELIPLFDIGYELIGRRTFSDQARPFYYFQSLSQDHENISGGGKLRRVQEMMGPNGIAGIFSDFANCTALKSAVSMAPITKILTLSDPWTLGLGYYTITASPGTAAIDPYVCVDNDPAGAGCSSIYDLIVSFESAGIPGEVEKNIMKLKCGSKLGRMETVEVEALGTGRSLYLWNTGDDSSGRFEEYDLRDGPNDEARLKLTTLQKTTVNDFQARNLTMEHQTGSYSGSIQEYHRDSWNIFQARYHLNSTSLADFKTNTSTLPYTNSFDFYRGIGAFGTDENNAQICMTVNETDIYNATQVPCTFGTMPITSSHGFDLILDDVMYIDSLVRDIFSLTTTAQDVIPDVFQFPDVTNTAISTQINSNIVLITGITGSVGVSITGGAYRICANNTCSTNPTFTSGPSTITNGQYLQLQQTSSSNNNTNVNVTIRVGLVSDIWTITTN